MSLDFGGLGIGEFAVVESLKRNGLVKDRDFTLLNIEGGTAARMAALKAGKHVWLEKPMARTILPQASTSLLKKASVSGSGLIITSKPADLKTTAMTDSAVQAMLDVFPAEIEKVEEIE